MIAYLTHRACELHDMGSGHPEQPARLRAIRERLRGTGLDRTRTYRLQRTLRWPSMQLIAAGGSSVHVR